MIGTHETVITAELNEQEPSLLTDPRNKELLKRKQDEWEEKIEPLLEAVRSSERLDESDYAIRINAKG